MPSSGGRYEGGVEEFQARTLCGEAGYDLGSPLTFTEGPLQEVGGPYPPVMFPGESETDDTLLQPLLQTFHCRGVPRLKPGNKRPGPPLGRHIITHRLKESTLEALLGVPQLWDEEGDYTLCGLKSPGFVAVSPAVPPPGSPLVVFPAQELQYLCLKGCLEYKPGCKVYDAVPPQAEWQTISRPSLISLEISCLRTSLGCIFCVMV